MSKSGSRLSRLGVLAPAALSACIDASVLAAPAAGALLSTVLNELNKAFMLKKWFHGIMSAQEAEQLLLQKGKQGSYLVRESRNHPGEYVLSIRVRSRVTHVMIRKEQNKYNVGSGELFDDLSELIDHCRAFPLTKASGEVLRLRQPVSGGRNRARPNPDKDIKKENKKPTAETGIAEKKPTMEHTPEDLGHNTNVTNNTILPDPTIPIDHVAALHEEFTQEYTRMVKQADKLIKFSKIIGYKEENRNKNRYLHVVPYDETRVPLPRYIGSVHDNFSNYINANYVRPQWMFDMLYPEVDGKRERVVTLHSADCESIIDKNSKSEPSTSSKVFSTDAQDAGSEEESDEDEAILRILEAERFPNPTQERQTLPEVAKDKFYIATQGCLETTRHAFWTMIADNDVRIIVMLSECIERETEKCNKYWPELNETWAFDYLKVTLMQEYTHPFYTFREILLTVTTFNRKRTTTVHQYQYMEWPDHSVPLETGNIIRLIRDVNARMFLVSQEATAPKHNIMCVHCSAGIGRTGTFIALDMLLDMIKVLDYANFDESLEIPAVVRLLRKQRPGMVHNVSQYKFIYAVIEDYVQNIIENDGVEKGPKVSF